MASPRLVEQAGFGLGLNLRDGPDAVEAAQAIDALNVTFTERGTLAVRPGSTLRYSNPAIHGDVHLLQGVELGGVDYNVVGYTSFLQLDVDLSNDLLAPPEGNQGGLHGGIIIDGGSYGNASFYSTAKVGTPALEELWVASDGARVRRVHAGGIDSIPPIAVDGAAAGGSHGNGTVVGVTPWDSRLLLGGFRTGCVGPGGQAVDRAKVFACDEANPMALHSDAFFRVGVGDGEDIMAIVTWREQVFIFKETRFWVMSGIGTDASGGPLFHRRPVEAGVGAVSPAAVTVGRDGVYFLSGNGRIYRSTGGAPQSVSDLVEPILTGVGSRYYAGGVLEPENLASVQLHWNDELLYVNFKADLSTRRNRQLVYDTRFGWWSLYDLRAGVLGSSRDGRLMISVGEDPIPVLRYIWQLDDLAVGDENGIVSTIAQRPFTARWRSGWIDFENPEVKVHAAVRAWGSGQPTLRVSRDFRASFDSARVFELSDNNELWSDGGPDDLWGDGSGPDVWGPVNLVDGVMSRRALAGSYFSFQLDGLVGLGSGQPFSVHRLTHYVRESRTPDSTRVHR